MRRIGIVTTNRADFSLLYPLICELRTYESSKLSVELIVSGSHLDEKFGNTINDINKMKVRVDHIVKMSINTKEEYDIALNQVSILSGMVELFHSYCFDLIIILGDRYEMFMSALAALSYRIPIVHLYGGDTTEGALDEYYRHALTKISSFHFVTNEQSRKRIIQMGEQPDRVFNYGATGTDNIINMNKYSKQEALSNIGIEMCDYALCTFHPVTTEKCSEEKSLVHFVNALLRFPSFHYIFVGANIDQGGTHINELLTNYEVQYPNIHVYSSLDVREYISLMKYASFVIGNSSSGILETPALKVPSINIGNRQKGRLQATNIINCNEDEKSIVECIKKVNTKEFLEMTKNVINPYGEGYSSKRIAKKIVEIVNDNIEMKKEFYTLL